MYHIGRGGMMEEHWSRFWSTGNVTDYLSYKARGVSSLLTQDTYCKCFQGQETSMGVSSGEPNCTDRNGIIYSARGGV